MLQGAYQGAAQRYIAGGAARWLLNITGGPARGGSSTLHYRQSNKGVAQYYRGACKGQVNMTHKEASQIYRNKGTSQHYLHMGTSQKYKCKGAF